MEKLYIVIPAYNEAESLPNLIDNIEKMLPDYDYVIKCFMVDISKLVAIIPAASK